MEENFNLTRSEFRHMDISRKISYYRIKTQRTLKREGFPALFRKLLRKTRVIALKTNCSVWLFKPLDEDLLQVTPKIAVEVRFLIENKDDLIAWIRKKNEEFPWMYFSQEIEAAHTFCHIYVSIMDGKEIIGYLKIGRDHVFIHDFEKLVDFPPADAFLYDIFVLPAYRKRKIAVYALKKTIEYLRKSGFSRLWCHIEEWNSPSLNTFRKAGFKEKASIRFIRILNISVFLKNGYLPQKIASFLIS